MPRVLLASLIGFTAVSLMLAWVLASRAARHAETQARRFRELLAHAAHQLRTPTATLTLELDAALANPRLDGTSRELAQRLQQQVSAQTELIERLLAHARMERMDEPAERLDAAVLLRDAERVLAPVADANGATLRMGCDGVAVVGRRAELTQLIVMLGENAIVHGGGSITVGISTERRWSVLTVTDTGQAARSASGNGLGLELARRIVDRHGGRLNLDIGDVSTVRVWLPRRKVFARWAH